MVLNAKALALGIDDPCAYRIPTGRSREQQHAQVRNRIIAALLIEIVRE